MQDQLDLVYRVGETTRFHTVGTLRNQNLADHHWHVFMIGHILYGQDAPGMSVVFMMALLTHDMAEEHFGDMPAPTKRGLAEQLNVEDFRDKYGAMEQSYLSRYSLDWEKFLTEEETRRLKLCDSLEGMLYCVKERSLGNKLIRTAYKNFESYVGELLEDCPDVPMGEIPQDEAHCHREWELFTYAKAKWEWADAS